MDEPTIEEWEVSGPSKIGALSAASEPAPSGGKIVENLISHDGSNGHPAEDSQSSIQHSQSMQVSIGETKWVSCNRRMENNNQQCIQISLIPHKAVMQLITVPSTSRTNSHSSFAESCSSTEAGSCCIVQASVDCDISSHPTPYTQRRPAFQPLNKRRKISGDQPSSSRSLVRRSRRRFSTLGNSDPLMWVPDDDGSKDDEGGVSSKRRCTFKSHSSSPHSITSTTLLTPRRSSISVGQAYQVADIVPLEEFVSPAASKKRESEQEDGRQMDECLWRPFPSTMREGGGDRLINAKSWDDYCAVARQHWGLEGDEALACAFANNYSIAESLAHMEEFRGARAHRNSANWNLDEIEAFSRQLNTGRKLFAKIAKNLPGKRVADVVEHYYAVKKARCPTSTKFLVCPYGINTCLPDPPTVSRGGCENCTKALWKNSCQKVVNRGKKKVALCLACALYLKLTKFHRPFTVPYEPTSTWNPQPVVYPPHEDCFFEPRLDRLRRRVRWTEEERLACVKAFRKNGRDFHAIAEEIPGEEKGAREVEAFYQDHRIHYQLDYLIKLHDGGSQEGFAVVSPTDTVAKMPLTNGRIRIVQSSHTGPNHSSNELNGASGRKANRLNEDYIAATAVNKYNPREPVGSVWSSMVTRNQRARRLQVRFEGKY